MFTTDFVLWPQKYKGLVYFHPGFEAFMVAQRHYTRAIVSQPDQVSKG